MKNKDWRERFQTSLRRRVEYILDNGRVVFKLSDLEEYLFEELDKAREEGLKDGVKGVWDMIPEKRRIASILSKSITPVERSAEMTKFIGRLKSI